MAELLEMYDLTDADYVTICKDDWKNMVDTNITDCAFQQLKDECSSMTKTKYS